MLKTIEKRSDRFFKQDLIRCVAMLCIFLFHFGISVRTNGIIYEHSPYSVGRNIILGQQGVSLFLYCPVVLLFYLLRVSWTKIRENQAEISYHITQNAYWVSCHYTGAYILSPFFC